MYLSLLLVMALMLPLGPVDAAAKPKLGSIAGTVTGYDGTRLAGVTVQIYAASAPHGSPVAAAVTGRGGTWQCKGLSVDDYLVFFVSPDATRYDDVWYEAASSSDAATVVSVVGSGTVRGVNAVLPAPLSITGVIYETGTETPVAGFVVGAHVEGVAQLQLVGELATTDADGRYAIYGLPAGNYWLLGNDPTGYHTAAWCPEQALFDPEVGPLTRDMWVDPAGAIAGRVLAGDGSTGLPDVVVEAFRAIPQPWGVDSQFVGMTTTGADGSFLLGGISYPAVRVRASGHTTLATVYYAGTSQTVPVLEYASDVDVSLQQTTGGIEIAMTVVAGSIGGRITDDITLNAISEGIAVTPYLWYLDGWYSAGFATNAADGTYLLAGLHPGNYHIGFFAEGTPYLDENYADQPVGPDQGDLVTVTAGEAVTVDADLTLAGYLEGHITGGAMGGPLSNVSIAVRTYDENWYQQWGPTVAWGGTDADGWYQIKVPAGEYAVWAQPGDPSLAAGFAPGEAMWEERDVYAVVSGQHATVDISLPQAGSLSGTVSDATDGALLSGIDVMVLAGSDRNALAYIGRVLTDEGGYYQFVQLFPGDYYVSLTDTANPGLYQAQWWDDQPLLASATPVTVVGGVPVVANPSLDRASLILGTALDEYDNPIPGVDVQVHRLVGIDEWQAGWGATTRDDGTFGVAVEPGTYRVLFAVSTPGWAKLGYPDTPGWAEQQCEQILIEQGDWRQLEPVHLQPGGQISGRVTFDGTDGQPAVGVQVRAFYEDLGCAAADDTDGNGEYTILGLPLGVSYRVGFYPAAGGAHYEFYADTVDWSDATLVPLNEGNPAPVIDASISVPLD